MGTVQEVKHTPGPWKVHPYTTKIGAYNRGRDVGPIGLSVCEVIGHFEHTGPGIGETEEANARLIAAVPDGYDAAKCAVSFLDEYNKTPVGRAAEQLFGAEMRAFIAKAEGR